MICACYCCVIGSKHVNQSESDKISEARISSNIKMTAMSPTNVNPADYHKDTQRGISKENVDTLDDVIKVIHSEIAKQGTYPDPEIPRETMGGLPVLNEGVEVIQRRQTMPRN